LVQVDRLNHARAHADFYILTDTLSPEDVLEKVLSFIRLAEK